MSEAHAVESMQDGWTILIQQAKVIAMLPLEDWLRAFERAESLAPVLDPTLYRNYVSDPDRKGERIKKLIEAAIPVKQRILEMQKHFDPRAEGAA